MRYDIIIVGAGSAGCVLAARLSEDPKRSVLLLEAGPDYSAARPPEIMSSHRPAYTHDWGYYSEPSHLGRPIHLVRAKLVGGCSATNATLALRGTPADYDEWVACGNTGWSYADTLPFFRHLESDADYDDEWHGQGGPLPIHRYPVADLTVSQSAFLEACTAAGYSRIGDHNAPGAIGVGLLPMNTVHEVRQSTAVTYLAAATHRPNLNVRPGVLVDRVVFEGHRAQGISLSEPSEMLWADRIILAAGAYSSPAILMRSGLGPADHLEALGITVLQDLPGVGRNLSDHPLFGLRFTVAALAFQEAVPLFQTMLTLKSSQTIQGHDVQIFPTSVVATSASDNRHGAMFMLFAALAKPFSRGQLRLRSADPNAAPIIDLGYFTHPADMPRMIDAVRAARQVSHTQPLSDLALEEQFPGSKVSDRAEDLQAAVWAAVETYHHPVGTCRMGSSTDSESVVDSRGNVHGIQNLSVVDASIMPTIPAANTNLPTIMVAERCAAWLVEG